MTDRTVVTADHGRKASRMDILEILPQAGAVERPSPLREASDAAAARPSWTAALREAAAPRPGSVDDASQTGTGAFTPDPPKKGEGSRAVTRTAAFFTPSRGTFELSGRPDTAVAAEAVEAAPPESGASQTDDRLPGLSAALAGFGLVAGQVIETQPTDLIPLPGGLREALGDVFPGLMELSPGAGAFELLPEAAPQGLTSLLSSTAVNTPSVSGLSGIAPAAAMMLEIAPAAAPVGPPQAGPQRVTSVAGREGAESSPLIGGPFSGAAAGFAQAMGAIANALPDFASMLPAVSAAEMAVPVAEGAAIPTSAADGRRAGTPDASNTATRDAINIPGAGAADNAPRHLAAVAPGGSQTVVSTTDPAAFAERLTRALVDSHQTGRPLHVRLHPPELGVLQIELSDRGGGMTARLEVETTAARQVILEQLPQLRDALTHAGHHIERIDVHLLEQADGRPQHHGGRHHSPGQFAEHGQHQEREDAPPPREPDDNGIPSPPHIRLARPAVIDTFDIQV